MTVTENCIFLKLRKLLLKAGMVPGCFIHNNKLFTMMRLLVVILFLHLSVCNAGDPCPPKYLLVPCTCTEKPVYMPPPQHGRSSTTEKSSLSTTTISTSNGSRSLSAHHEHHISRNDTFYTIVKCKSLKSIQELDGVVSSALNRMLVDKLTVESIPPLKENDVARLPSKWLSKVRVRSIQILNSVLYGDFIWAKGRPFEGQEHSLIWFAANNCSLTGFLTYNHPGGNVYTQGLDYIPSIQGLNFSNNLLTHVTNMAFRYPPAKLSTVILSHNCIESVQAGTFLYTPLLRYLDLSHNVLESITRNIFEAHANNLEYINLSWNSLTTLPADFFNNMPSLKVVEISHNFLFTLAEKPWAAVWKNLTYVDVAANFVECNCELMWLVNITSPAEDYDYTTASRPSSGQTILGTCSKIVQRGELTSRYELATLTSDHLDC